MQKKTSQRNRGKYLETLIERSNIQYDLKGIATINKIPTPMTHRSRDGKIFDARYTKKSTVDFIGIHNGKFIAFDTKQTSLTNLPFKNIEQHQIEYLTKTHEKGGICFILILFTKFNELYRLDIQELKELKESLNRASIPYTWFKENKRPITSNNGIIYNYL